MYQVYVEHIQDSHQAAQQRQEADLMQIDVTRIDCSEVKFGDFEFRYGYCGNCHNSGSVMTTDHGLYNLCGSCMERGFKLLMKLLNTEKKLV